MDRIARIYVVFSSSGLQGECRIFPIYHPDVEIVTNEKILETLKEKCEGVEFVGETAPVTGERAKFVIANVRARRKSLDGVLYFGAPPDELMSIGLPIIAVYPLWGRWMPTFDAYKGKKVLTSCLPVVYDKDMSIFSSRLEDIVGKIRLIQAISKMKRLKVLVITDKPVLGEFEPTLFQTGLERKEYEEVYLGNLEKTFGMELISIPQGEIVSEMEAADEEKAKEAAKKWIDEAEGMEGTNEVEVVKSAKLYLAMKKLMEKYGCGAITTEGYISRVMPKDTSQGLPSSQFCTDGIVATSETLIDSLITQQLGLHITGSTGFNGDYMIDTFNAVAIIGHCECPLNPYGNDRRAPYIIRNLPLWEENKGGACVQVNLPLDETVTVAKISMHDKKISVFTGKTVSGEELFEYWDDLLCRTKLAIETNAKALLENLDWKTFGNHRVAFYGDHREKIKDLATLIGFEVVEKDR